jgi:tetratricopeptide (TPR) repeat protein
MFQTVPAKVKKSQEIRTLKERAERYTVRGSTKKAVKIYRKLVRADPKNPRWPHKLGESYLRLGDFQQASMALQNAAILYSQQGFPKKERAVLELIKSEARRTAPDPAKKTQAHCG